MQAITFYLGLPFLYLLSLLPFPLFYRVCDLLYFILFRVLRYRKKVVLTNLRNAFPDKTEAEIQLICKRYYRYLCDLFLETFKTLTIRRKTALKRCTLDPSAEALIKKYEQEKKSIIIVMGHYGNWEWAGNTFSLTFKQPLYVIYHPLRNPHFDKLIYKMRRRFGTRLIAMRDTYKEMANLRSEVNATAFIADQTPSPDNAYWTTFLSQETPVFWGTERIAKKLNYPVVYISIRREKRGRYRIFATTLFENPADTKDGEISEAHTRILEGDIQRQPEIWLWSHKRWKHKKPAQS